MRKFIVLLALFAVLGCYAEEQKTGVVDTDAAALFAKVTELEGRLDKLAQEVEKMQAEVEKLTDSNAKLAKGLRNLELATQAAASTRPDMDTWKSVKKWMSAEAVQDLLGNPEEIKELKNSNIWYYYGLGSITFDLNGKVIYTETFKQLPLEGKVR